MKNVKKLIQVYSSCCSCCINVIRVEQKKKNTGRFGLTTKTHVQEQNQCDGRITSTLSKPSVNDSPSGLNSSYSFWDTNYELTLEAGIDAV